MTHREPLHAKSYRQPTPKPDDRLDGLAIFIGFVLCFALGWLICAEVEERAVQVEHETQVEQ